MNAEFKFTVENVNLAKEIEAKYPKDRRFSAIMPLLTLAQKQNGGYLTQDIIVYLATYLNVSIMTIAEVANFYSMYNNEPVGKYLIQTCNSIVCCIKGSDKINAYVKELTGTLNQSISADGLFSVKKVECLGACVNAVVIKVNDVFVEDVDEEMLKNYINSIKYGVFPEEQTKVKKPCTIENN